jgi:hypothetical protein
VLPGFRGKAEKSHDLGHSGSGYPFPAGNVGLVPDLASVELSPPLDGPAEECGYVGSLGIHRRFEIPLGQRYNPHKLVSSYPPRQGADVAVFKDPHWADGDLHRLFVEGRQGRAVLAVQGGVDDSEPDLGACGARSVSRGGLSTIFRLATP